MVFAREASDRDSDRVLACDGYRDLPALAIQRRPRPGPGDENNAPAAGSVLVDVDDFERFARGQLPRLTRYAVMLTGERDLAADLVQDVLLTVFRRWGHIGELDRPDRYVLRMLTNQHLSWRRRWAVRSILPAADVPDSPDDADHAAEHAVRDDLWQRLTTLPKQQRAVVVLRYYEQLPDADIADIIGCSATTVRGYAFRALATLRAGLAAEPTLATQENR